MTGDVSVDGFNALPEAEATRTASDLPERPPLGRGGGFGAAVRGLRRADRPG